MHIYPFSFLYRIFPVLILFFIACGVYWFTRLNELNQVRQEIAIPPRHVADYLMQNFSGSMLNKEGLVRYRIQGDVLVRYEDDHSYEITNPALRLFHPEQPELTVSARIGKMDGIGEQVDLLGDARLVRSAVKNSKPSAEIRAQSEFFRMLINQDILETNLPVKLYHGASMMTADGMTYRNVERSIELRGNVHGLLMFPKN